MKKIIGMVIASLLFSNIGYAEIRMIENTYVGSDEMHVATICVDGYKFVATRFGEGRSIVQFMRKHVGVDRKYILPQEC